MAVADDKASEEFLRLYGTEAWDDWRRLLAHFDLGEGFAFLVLLLPGAVGASICQRQLADHLAAKGKKLAVLSCEWLEEARQVAARLFALEAGQDLGGVWFGRAIPDSDPEIDRWKAAWRSGLASLNEQRNALRRRFVCPLVFVGAPWLQPLLREAAPDLWSVRTAVVAVTPSAQPGRPGEELPTGFGPGRSVMMGEAAHDPDFAREQADRLRDRPALESARADLLVRAAIGFYEHARYAPAEQCLREAVRLFRGLAGGGTPLQDRLAGGLNNLSVALRQLGKREEAVADAREAVQIYEQLAQTNPDAFLTGVATALNNLAASLSHLGRPEQALAKAQEAARICERMAKARPDAFLPDLATSLNNLAAIMAGLGIREGALAKAQEAVHIHQQLAQAHPDAFAGGLATSCGTRGAMLNSLGRHAEAADSFRQGIQALAPAFAKLPAAFGALMGNLCRDYVRSAQQAGREPDTALVGPVVERLSKLEQTPQVQ
jgi:tetratricopeptide (TPR) repeat protein